ncbi:MAG: RrF2 family transcriptional regulator [Gemmatimonadota bacterium]
MISRTAEYALRAVLYLARRETGESVRTTEMAGETGVPANYLSKILHRLGRRSIVTSERGPHGGFRLARPAGEISLAEVIEPFGIPSETVGCLLGRAECSDSDPCSAHKRWKAVNATVRCFFDDTSVADLLEKRNPARTGKRRHREPKGGEDS